MNDAGPAGPIEAPHSEIESQLALLADEIVGLQRMAMLGATSAMAAHEFNNLMTPVLALSQEALRRGDAALMTRALEKSVAQVTKATGLATRLLAAAQDASAAAEGAAGVSAAVENALGVLARSLEKDGISLALQIHPDVRVRAQPLLFEQVMLNLILNARSAVIGQKGRIGISATREGQSVLIEVRDSGRGLSAEQLAKFNAFLAADERERPRDWAPIGLGLAVCRRIARMSGATISFAANVGGAGCMVRMSWPAG